MKPLSLASLLAFGAVLGGCGHSLEYTATNTPPRPMTPRDPASVEVFMMTKPSRPHVEVGVFEIEQRTPASGSTPEMIAKLRGRAGAIGCDAIMVGEAQERIQSTTSHTHGTVHVTSAPSHGHGHGTYQGISTGHANVVRRHSASCITYVDTAASGPRDVAL